MHTTPPDSPDSSRVAPSLALPGAAVIVGAVARARASTRDRRMWERRYASLTDPARTHAGGAVLRRDIATCGCCVSSLDRATPSAHRRSCPMDELPRFEPLREPPSGAAGGEGRLPRCARTGFREAIAGYVVAGGSKQILVRASPWPALAVRVNDSSVPLFHQDLGRSLGIRGSFQGCPEHRPPAVALSASGRCYGDLYSTVTRGPPLICTTPSGGGTNSALLERLLAAAPAAARSLSHRPLSAGRRRVLAASTRPCGAGSVCCPWSPTRRPLRSGDAYGMRTVVELLPADVGACGAEAVLVMRRFSLPTAPPCWSTSWTRHLARAGLTAASAGRTPAAIDHTGHGVVSDCSSGRSALADFERGCHLGYSTAVDLAVGLMALWGACLARL
jgi:hypothetical protein